jgi:hypothetical protein
MEMQNRHIIGRQTILLQLPSQPNACDLQQQASRLFWETVAPALEELFDRYAAADELISIEKLQVDLGFLQEKNWARDFPQRVVERVEETLREQLTPAGHAPGATRQPLREGHFEQWLHFLEFGILHWNAPHSDREALLQKSVLDTLASESVALHRLGRLLKENDLAFERLLRQHPESFLKTLAAVFTARNQDALLVFRQNWAASVARMKASAYPLPDGLMSWAASHAARFPSVFWEHVLQRVILEGRQTASLPLIESFLQAVAPMRYLQFLNEVIGRGALGQTGYGQLLQPFFKNTATGSGELPAQIAHENKKARAGTSAGLQEKTRLTETFLGNPANEPGVETSAFSTTDNRSTQAPDNAAERNETPALSETLFKKIESGTLEPGAETAAFFTAEKPATQTPGIAAPPREVTLPLETFFEKTGGEPAVEASPPQGKTQNKDSEDGSLPTAFLDAPYKDDSRHDEPPAMQRAAQEQKDEFGEHAVSQNAANEKPPVPETSPAALQRMETFIGKTETPTAPETPPAMQTTGAGRLESSGETEVVFSQTAALLTQPDVLPESFVVFGKTGVPTLPTQEVGQTNDEVSFSPKELTQQETPAQMASKITASPLPESPEKAPETVTASTTNDAHSPLEREAIRTATGNDGARPAAPDAMAVKQDDRRQPPEPQASGDSPAVLANPGKTGDPTAAHVQQQAAATAFSPDSPTLPFGLTPGNISAIGAPTPETAYGNRRIGETVLPPTPLPRRPTESCGPVRKKSPLLDGPDTQLFVQYAGLVLLHPYLPAFFKGLGLMAEKEFKDETCRHRAIHLLHYLATKESGLPEFMLLLPKLLCGMPFEEPMERYPDFSETETAECENLLRAVIQNWGALGKSSPDALREGFLRRDGKLEKLPDGWKLTVGRQTLDILMGKLPWGLGIVKLPWMPGILRVEWG